MARLALLSVSDKTGIVELARSLVDTFGFRLISSGGTAKTLMAAGLPVTKVSDYTGSPEILGGRVKTLHPRIHGGILARPDLEGDRADLAANAMEAIDLVVVNLYPFEQTVAQAGVTLDQAIENIDIGGPTMIRAAAKNHAYLTVLCNPHQYGSYLQALGDHDGTIPLSLRQSFALAAFRHTAAYDRAIVTYLTETLPGDSEDSATPHSALPSTWDLQGQRVQSLRYGENPHQEAAWYQTGAVPTGWAAAQQIQGKELSYNNLVDLEAARRIIAEFVAPDHPPAVAILKHNNPCGVALGDSQLQAYQAALAADPVSAFGGIVAFNQPLDTPTAAAMTDLFLECIVVPGCGAEAAELLQKKSKVRVLILPDLTTGPVAMPKPIAGGFLLQNADTQMELPDQWQIVTQAQPTAAQLEELLFAWKVVKHVKSNAIVVSRDRATAGVGAGQMNRVGSVKIALEQAGEKAQGAVLSSDAFFPFDDSVRTAAAAGIAAIIQPGGSMRDKDSIAAADELGLVMVLTGVRHFLH
ncbi:bifunctional phosphoribosylaminoimidazolecarboxamide formyltransferase/IMP cyclohydrolase [Prochlorothrix hollandica]|uniref:Bifunctional purine biosynthesis protein PurH n=1 Tax=Prochlorothrix hollandica PCC 9006 = CALU 1027 TaxID=317619 RepID=A0A0M2PY96_PROHO|nr:bifunctional phosphoribosylaminoimidazolecarboxamide formyltransferase/IMP cyclohydrolase [Prochlorothrix hollandica]KKJ01145.1 phosphoribosylaminoimidazolecarboxamide formyltransferase [Prochlorothrix hollandica PCC 9006 = CALU 1027]